MSITYSEHDLTAAGMLHRKVVTFRKVDLIQYLLTTVKSSPINFWGLFHYYCLRVSEVILTKSGSQSLTYAWHTMYAPINNSILCFLF